jgi:outer membrane beta-barrel protein
MSLSFSRFCVPIIFSTSLIYALPAKAVQEIDPPDISPAESEEQTPKQPTQIGDDKTDENKDVIVITATRKATAIDRRSYDISAPDAASLTAADAMARLPGVITDIEGNMTILGEPNINYLVDGEYFPRSLALQIPANQIERIEIVTNPGANTSGSGITVNLILKKDFSAPQSLNINARADTRERYKLSADYSKDDGKWKNLALINLKSDLYESTRQTNSIYLNPLEIGQTGLAQSARKTENKNLFFYASAYRKLSNGRTLGGSIGGSASDYMNKNTLEFTRFNEDVILQNRQKNSFSESQFNSTSLNLNYIKEYTKDDRYSLFANYSIFSGDSVTRDLYTIDSINGNFLRNQMRDGDSYIVMFKREKKFSPEKQLKYGLDHRSSIINQRFDGVDSLQANGLLPDGTFDRKTSSMDAYISYQFPLGKLGLLPAIRFNSLDAEFTADGNAISQSPSYSRFLPSLHISRDFKDWGKLQASVAVKSLDPRYSAFDPILRKTNYNNFAQGNADLEIGTSANYELSHEFIKDDYTLLTTLYFRDKTNDIRGVYDYLGNDEYITQFINIDSDERLGVNVNFQQDIGTDFEYAIDLNLYNFQRQWQLNGRDFSLKQDSYDAKFNATYKFDKKSNLLLALQYQGENAGIFTTRAGRLSSSVKYVKNFDNNLSLTLEGIDLLASETRKSGFRSEFLERDTIEKRKQRGFRITLSRQF